MEAVLSDKLERASLATTQEEHKPYDDENLSQLSCSTANNEDFYEVLRNSAVANANIAESDHNKDKEQESDGSETSHAQESESVESPIVEAHTPAAAGDSIHQISVAAQTSKVSEKKNKSESLQPGGFYGLRPPMSNPFTPRVNRLHNGAPFLNSHAPEFRGSPVQCRYPMAPPIPAYLRTPQGPGYNQGARVRSSSISQMSFDTSLPLRMGPGASSSLSHHRPIPMKQFDTPGQVTYPLIHVSPAGTISLVVAIDLLIEMAVDRSIRIVSHDHFATTINSRGTASAILHQRGKILHQDENVWCKFTSSNDKMCAFSPLGVFFTMSHLQEGYLVSTNAPSKGAVAVQLDPQQFSNMDQDFTIKLFYTEAQSGAGFLSMCNDLVHEATYERRPDGTLSMNVNGVHIRYNSTGELHVDARPRQITCNPRECTVQLRSPYIDMAVQTDEKAYVKRSTKRVHVSRSGMVVSDGNCITSMDHFGRIVSCT